MSTISFLAHLKLGRLREQRDVLLGRYRAIGAAADAAPSPSAKLRALYDGLRAMDVAGAKLHPAVTNLDAVLLLGDDDAAVASWTRRLEHELAAGKLRCDVMYAFGAVLEQGAAAAPSSHKSAEAPPDHDARVAAARARTPPAFDRAFIERVLARPDVAQLRSAMADVVAGVLYVEPIDIDDALNAIVKDPEKKPALRAEAAQFLRDDDLKKDLVDGMRMVLADVETWRWPDAGVPLRSVWTGDRFRLHLDFDLVTFVLFHVVAARCSQVTGLLRGAVANRLARVARLRELNAPEIILENEERLLQEASAGLLVDKAILDEKTHPSSILAAREGALLELMSAGLRASAYGGEYGTSLRTLAFIVAAEVAVATATKRELHLAKTDIVDFFPSLNHELVLLVAERFGIPQHLLDVIGRYLAAAPVGLPLGMDLSRLLGELVMCVIELHVRSEAPSVRVARLVDDVVLIAGSPADLGRAWSALFDVARALGLSLSPDKSGAVAVGTPGSSQSSSPSSTAKRSEAGPAGAFRIGGLELDGNGTWRVSENALAEALSLARTKIEEARSLLDAVSVYNTHARRLVASLVPSAPFGADHLAQAAACVTRFQDRLFADHGFRERARRDVAALAPGEWLARVPQAWLHWPLTAGGLGVVDGHVELAPYVNAMAPVQPPPAMSFDTIPADVDTGDNHFARLYRAMLSPKTPREPEANPLVDGLAEDFMKRKNEMQGKAAAASTTLAPYWRWVLSTHGPDIVDAFGSYRFLLHQLLPITLINSRRFARAEAGELSTASETRDTDDDIPF